MNLKCTAAILLVAAVTIFAFNSCRPTQTRNRLDESHFPSIVLWAWERPEDLRALDTKKFAVAFLAQTLTLKGDEVVFKPRHQPLEVSPDTKMMAVTRIESQKQTGERAALSEAQKQKLVDLIMRTTTVGAVSAIQIDFDAASSEREFYRSLLRDLRAKLPDNVPLSMTALASFCVGDRWLDDLPVDEAGPMFFRMGADDRVIKNMLTSGDDFREPLCRKSYGVATDELFEMKRDASRRLYIFNDRPWNESSIAGLKEGWLR
jgi:hypothetical protein